MTHDNEEPLTAEERAAIDRGLADARAGRFAPLPAAWCVVRVGGRVMAILDALDEAESLRERLDQMENWVHEIVPLYTSPALTDAERDAVETAALEADAHQHTQRAATLRGLLERQVFLQKNLTDPRLAVAASDMTLKRGSKTKDFRQATNHDAAGGRAKR